MIRSNDVMYKAGQTEMVILRKLSGADPNGKRHCVRMLRSFEYRQHLCLVFESMVNACATCHEVCCFSSDPDSRSSPLREAGAHQLLRLGVNWKERNLDMRCFMQSSVWGKSLQAR